MMMIRIEVHTLINFLSLIILMCFCSCDKNSLSSSSEMTEVQPLYIAGSAYIQCEMGPFYIAHSDLESCLTEFGFDSMMTVTWEPGCSMTELMGDSVGADFKMTYLSQSELMIESISSNFTALPFELIFSTDTIDVNSYPYQGSLQYESEGRTYSFVIVNRYIGGCFHDELIWEIRD